MAHVILASLGTDGDIFPYVGLGRVLRGRGHRITLGEKTFPADHHAVVMIYPNPLNPNRYVVLNSGFTFRQADHKTNSRQIAKLPDYAIIDLTTPPDDKVPGAIPAAGFFNESWQLK